MYCKLNIMGTVTFRISLIQNEKVNMQSSKKL